MTITTLPSGRYRLQIRRKAITVDEIFASQKDAEDAERRYLGKISRHGKDRLTVRDALGLYQDDRSFVDKKETTRRGEATHVKPALEAFGDRAIRTIEPDDIETFIRDELRAEKAADTIRNEVAAFSALLNFCVARHYLPRNPCIGVRRPSPEPKMRRMQPNEEGALMMLLNNPKFRFRSAARLCLLVRETGARPGEWRATRWSDIDLEKHRVTFPNTKYKRQPRTVPLTEAALTLLTSQLEDVAIRNAGEFGDSEYIFPTIGLDGSVVPLRYSGTIRDLKKQKLIPKGLRPHNGRHEFITKLVEDSDIDDSRIMTLVGHHSPASMQIYTHARAVRLRPQLESLEDGRRSERTQSIAQVIGLPQSVVRSYLEHRREEAGGDDPRNELLYEDETVGVLQHAASRLGSTPEDRLRKLLAIARESAAGRVTSGNAGRTSTSQRKPPKKRAAKKLEQHN